MNAKKILGYLLIVAGFLAGAYVAVRTPDGVAVPPFLLALGVGVLGVALVRWALVQEATHEDTVAANIETLEASLVTLVEDLEALDREKESIDVYDLRHRIDDTFPPHLDSFVQARESMKVHFGLQAYADVMSAFATGERNLNRVWSASTDGYIDEAHTYIHLAHQEMDEALRLFRAAEG